MMRTNVSTAAQPMPSTRTKGSLLQRKCACGNLTPGGGQCSVCSKNRDSDVGAAVYGTGMPRSLNAAIEALSGMDLSGVQVHSNSSKPAQLNALAYTQGEQIHLGPGQEKHLPHEGWHVVQQLQGRVKPSTESNAVPINDDSGLEHEADIMGAKARRLAAQAGTTDFRTRLSTAGGGVVDDEPFAVAATNDGTRQNVAPGQGASIVPVIQRVAKFVSGAVNATTNMASHIIAGNMNAGFTPPTLNGTTILSTAAARGAINKPTISGMPKPDGTSEVWVGTVPTNEGSFTMQAPSGGPWSTVTTKANVATLFSALGLSAQAGCSTAGNSTFSVNGKPSDAAFAANVLTHENLHAADHKSGFSSVIVPWDTKLDAAKLARTKFGGTTAAAAETALWTAMGGTPDQIATQQFNTWIALNNVTHTGATLATGGPATPSNSSANATCATSSLDAT